MSVLIKAFKSVACWVSKVDYFFTLFIFCLNEFIFEKEEIIPQQNKVRQVEFLLYDKLACFVWINYSVSPYSLISVNNKVKCVKSWAQRVLRVY